MIDILGRNPTIEIIDSTKLQTAQECMRKYFYEYVLGWRSEMPNNHLYFGTCIHKAMEFLKANDYSIENTVKAFDIFNDAYRELFTPETDGLFAPKVPDRVLPMLSEYINEYKNDKEEFEVLYTEVSGTVPIDLDRVLYFRQDTICRDLKENRGIFSLEHKTAGKTLDDKWCRQWFMKTQTGTYTHVLYCLFPDEDIFGVVINGLGLLKTKFSFRRVPIKRDKESMRVWLWNTLYWIDQIYWNYERLEKCKEDDPVMMCFPMNTESCSDYFGCPFLDFCNSWTNPLAHCDEPPIGFKIEFWNPMAEESKHKVEKGKLVS